MFKNILHPRLRIIGKIKNIGKGNLSNTVIKECIDEASDGQRIDNFLFKRYRGVPKSHIYQIVRSGQVRVNGKRINAKYRLQFDDIVRIPPIKKIENNVSNHNKNTKSQSVNFNTVFEDETLLVIDKPAGMAVHGGSGVSFGVIEQLRIQHPDWKFLELAHRLDRDTSGVLLLAKKRAVLVDLHRQIRNGLTKKHYQVMVKGKWCNTIQHVKLPLNKYLTTTGERRVVVSTDKHKTQKSLTAYTVFRLQMAWNNFSLLDAELKTGRTHQIRVHLAHLGFPIIGDDKYGDFVLNKQLAKKNDHSKLTRMFLHAHKMQITHPVSGACLQLEAPLSCDLQEFLGSLGDT